MKNILVATDFSNNSYNALFFATQLFKERKANFILMNAFTEQTKLLSQKVGAPGKFDLLDQLADESAEGLNQHCHKINLDSDNEQHHFETLSINDHLTDAINRTIKTHKIDLLVMGNSGKSKNKGNPGGNKVQKVLKEIELCPVLSVPLEMEFEIPTEIAFATDYHHMYDAAVLNPLIQIASISKASVCILHVNEEDRLSSKQKTNLYTLREYLGNIPHSVHWMPDFSSKSKVITTFLEELGISMLVMVRYEHGFFEGLTREPVIKNLCNDLKIPLLIIPYKH